MINLMILLMTLKKNFVNPQSDPSRHEMMMMIVSQKYCVKRDKEQKAKRKIPVKDLTIIRYIKREKKDAMCPLQRFQSLL